MRNTQHEDHIYIFVDYQKRKKKKASDIEAFKSEIIEEGLGYKPNCNAHTYMNRTKTSTLKVMERDGKAGLMEMPMYLIPTLMESGDYNISMVLNVPRHKNIQGRDIKGAYDWVAQYFDANGIDYKTLNPPKDERNRLRITAQSGGLEKELSEDTDVN